MKAKDSAAKSHALAVDSVRTRILGAAMGAFREKGYAQTSTLEIATRAQVSKRELYALFGSKQAMLTACIKDRAERITAPQLPLVRDLAALCEMLQAVGATMLREVCDPVVTSVFRLAIAEAPRAPEVAQVLDAHGRQVSHTAVCRVLQQAQCTGLIGRGDAAEMTSQFLALLWGDLMINLLLHVREPPGSIEIERRAQNACAAFLRLHSATD